jgi:hypothetical protein
MPAMNKWNVEFRTKLYNLEATKMWAVDGGVVCAMLG